MVKKIDIYKLVSEEKIETLRNALQNREMVVISLNKELLNEIYNLEKLNFHLNNTLPIYPYVSVNNHKSTTSKRDLITRSKDKYLNSLEVELSLKNVLYRIAKGDTLVLSKLHKFNKELRELADFFSKQFLAKVNINLYYAYKNTKGINLHFDYDDILSIQIHGKKYWKIYKKEIGKTFKLIEEHTKPSTDNHDDFFEIETNVGDLLFIPKGVWHFAYTQEASSIHLSTSLKPLKIKTLFDFLLNNSFDNLGEKSLYNFTEQSLIEEIKNIVSQLGDISLDKETLEQLEQIIIPKEYKIELE